MRSSGLLCASPASDWFADVLDPSYCAVCLCNSYIISLTWSVSLLLSSFHHCLIKSSRVLLVKGFEWATVKEELKNLDSGMTLTPVDKFTSQIFKSPKAALCYLPAQTV